MAIRECGSIGLTHVKDGGTKNTVYISAKSHIGSFLIS